jgi:MYXO-CTERM domain-containing protein
MMRSPLVAACAAMALVGTAQAGTATSTYSSNFTNADGNYYGAAFRTTSNGHSDLQLTTDYPGDYYGTWTSGALQNTSNITGFNASFKFSFNTNGDGATEGDGFSFLFGNLTDGMDGAGDWGHSYLQNWNGGEWGFNNFSRLGSGMSVDLAAYGDDYTHARWASAEQAYNNIDDSLLQHLTYYGYDYALNDSVQGTMYIDWDTTGDLVVYLEGPDNAYGAGYAKTEILRTSAFQGIDTTGFTFGFAGRVGGATWDVLIDDVNIDYSYSTPVVPGPAGIVALAGLAAVRRRRR